MGGSPRAIHGNPFAKVVFGGVAAMLIAFAPPTARAAGAAESYDFQICHGYFALCAASTCKPTGGLITVRTATGGTATFPGADCKCSVILGPSIANLAGGNMRGSCEPPERGQHLVDLSAQTEHSAGDHQLGPEPARGRGTTAFLPEETRSRKSVGQLLQLRLPNSQTYINNVPVVTCHCPIGESLAGTPVPPHTSFLTQAGQGDRAFCADHPSPGRFRYRSRVRPSDARIAAWAVREQPDSSTETCHEEQTKWGLRLSASTLLGICADRRSRNDRRRLRRRGANGCGS